MILGFNDVACQFLVDEAECDDKDCIDNGWAELPKDMCFFSFHLNFIILTTFMPVDVLK